jgi:hypothetical protein
MALNVIFDFWPKLAEPKATALQQILVDKLSVVRVTVPSLMFGNAFVLKLVNGTRDRNT